VASWLGGQELLLGRVYSVDEAVALLEAVTSDDLRRVAADLLVTDQLYLALVGPFRSDKRFAPLLRL